MYRRFKVSNELKSNIHKHSHYILHWSKLNVKNNPVNKTNKCTEFQFYCY